MQSGELQDPVDQGREAAYRGWSNTAVSDTVAGAGIVCCNWVEMPLPHRARVQEEVEHPHRGGCSQAHQAEKTAGDGLCRLLRRDWGCSRRSARNEKADLWPLARKPLLPSARSNRASRFLPF